MEEFIAKTAKQINEPETWFHMFIFNFQRSYGTSFSLTVSFLLVLFLIIMVVCVPPAGGSWRFQLVIIEKQSDKLIGDIGLHFFDVEHQQVEIGCTLDKNFQGKGFATEALAAVFDYLFQKLNKNRVITSIDPENKNSIRLVKRLGFRKEAHFVESIFMNGKWVDDLIYALLEKDWQKTKS